MNIETLVVSPFQTNCYLVWKHKEKGAVIIDPGDEDELIVGRLEKLGLNPLAILLTHGHIDHIGAVEAIKKRFHIPLYVGQGEEELLSSPSANGAALLGYQISCPSPDHSLGDGEVVTIGDMEFSVFATPGHSPGGICYFIENCLFCGDTLFAGSIGRTDLPGGDYDQLIESIQKNILTLPENIVCYPGHGPATTVGREKHSNPFLIGGRFV